MWYLRAISHLRDEDRLVFYDISMEPFYLRLTQPIWLVHSQQKKELMGSIYVAERRPTPPAVTARFSLAMNNSPLNGKRMRSRYASF